MAISLVQHTFTATGTSAASVAATYTSTPTAGNLLVVGLLWFTGNATTNAVGTYSIADTAGNSWNKQYISNVQGGNGCFTGDLLLFWAGNCLSHASNQVTVSCSGTALTGAQLIIAEFSGILKVNDPSRAVATNFQVLGSFTSPSVSVTSASGDLVVGYVGGDNGQTAAGSGFSLVDNAGSNGTVMEYLAPATGASTTVTTAATDDGWIIFGASFKPLSSSIFEEDPGGFSAGTATPGVLILASPEELPSGFPGLVEEWSFVRPPDPILWASSPISTVEEWVQKLTTEEEAPPLLGWVTPSGAVPFTYDEEFAQTAVVNPALEEWPGIFVAPATPIAPPPFAYDEERAILAATSFEEYAATPMQLFFPVVCQQSAPFTDEEYLVFVAPPPSTVQVDAIGVGHYIGLGHV